MKALCCLPHNDDIIISLGGSILKLLNKKWEIAYLYLTDSRHGSNTLSSEETLKIRATEAAKEREYLDIKQFYELGIEDGTLSKLTKGEIKELNSKTLKILEEYKPHIIFIPSKAEMHVDHRMTHDLLWNIINLNKLNVLVCKYGAWLFPDFWRKQLDISDKIVCINIDSEFENKLRGIRLHDSQIRRGQYDEIVISLNSYFAKIFKTGAEHAEILALFNKTENNSGVEKKLLDDLDIPKDITEFFHGRASQKIRI